VVGDQQNIISLRSLLKRNNTFPVAGFFVFFDDIKIFLQFLNYFTFPPLFYKD